MVNATVIFALAFACFWIGFISASLEERERWCKHIYATHVEVDKCNKNPDWKRKYLKSK